MLDPTPFSSRMCMEGGGTGPYGLPHLMRGRRQSVQRAQGLARTHECPQSQVHPTGQTSTPAACMRRVCEVKAAAKLGSVAATEGW